MRKIIRADGTYTMIEHQLSISAIEKMIGADTIDTVLLTDRVHVMIVDDAGHQKGLPVNAAATALYHARCLPGTTHQIVGDVVIVPDSDFGSQS